VIGRPSPSAFSLAAVTEVSAHQAISLHSHAISKQARFFVVTLIDNSTAARAVVDLLLV
jgi:hypothetical protein